MQRSKSTIYLYSNNIIIFIVVYLLVQQGSHVNTKKLLLRKNNPKYDWGGTAKSNNLLCNKRTNEPSPPVLTKNCKSCLIGVYEKVKGFGTFIAPNT